MCETQVALESLYGSIGNVNQNHIKSKQFLQVAKHSKSLNGQNEAWKKLKELPATNPLRTTLNEILQFKNASIFDIAKAKQGKKQKRKKKRNEKLQF